MTLTTGLVNSINIIPVRLAQAFGRDKIVETAQKMGITSELRITRSLPLGASEVKVIDMAGAYAAFANGGYQATPYGIHPDPQQHAARFSTTADATRRRRSACSPEEVVADMNGMLVQVPEWGTGRRAKLDGIRTAGKTGTTSAYRDAWFCGFTGNYAAAVWFGNDSYAPTRRLTGGMLPAQTWKEIMTFAHKGVDLKPIPFIDNPMEKPATDAAVAANAATDANTGDNGGPATLSAAATERLLSIEQLMRNAPRLKPLAALAAPAALTTVAGTPADAASPAPATRPIVRRDRGSLDHGLRP